MTSMSALPSIFCKFLEQQTGVKLQRDAMALQRVRQAAEQAKK